MGRPEEIRLMMFIGPDEHQSTRTCHYQVTNFEKRVTFGHWYEGRMIYGFASIADSRLAFREAVEGKVHDKTWVEEDNDDWSIDDVV
jgi:hypothetical protein